MSRLRFMIEQSSPCEDCFLVRVGFRGDKRLHSLYYGAIHEGGRYLLSERVYDILENWIGRPHGLRWLDTEKVEKSFKDTLATAIKKGWSLNVRKAMQWFDTQGFNFFKKQQEWVAQVRAEAAEKVVKKRKAAIKARTGSRVQPVTDLSLQW